MRGIQCRVRYKFATISSSLQEESEEEDKGEPAQEARQGIRDWEDEDDEIQADEPKKKKKKRRSPSPEPSSPPPKDKKKAKWGPPPKTGAVNKNPFAKRVEASNPEKKSSILSLLKAGAGKNDDAAGAPPKKKIFGLPLGKMPRKV